MDLPKFMSSSCVTTWRIRLLDVVRNLRQYSVYKEYIKYSDKLSKWKIEEYQDNQFKRIFSYHFNNNVAYRDFVLQHGYAPGGRISIDDIPFMKKRYFVENTEHSIKKNCHIKKSSGGSTGIPLTYYMCRESASHMFPAIWRAFDVYDIKPCQKIIMIAGPSLFNNRSIKRQIYDFISNFEVISAFDLNEELMMHAYKLIKSNEIKAIYGYTSSIFVFLKFLEQKQLYLNLNCIFTTSETFINPIRSLALSYCNCDVIDIYGANDGGINGFECKEHCGYHLNFERCYVEVVDNKIIVTDLLNKASPFIRYVIGDMTTANDLSYDKCACGRGLFRLPNISGRINETIEDLDGKIIHTEFFSHIFSDSVFVEQYQIRDTLKMIYVNLVTNKKTSEETLIPELRKYNDLISRKIKRKFKLVLNEPIKKLDNDKVPVLIRF